MEDDWGRARAMAQGKDQPDKLQEAIDTCPVNCIYWVTAPQLSLLEAAMAKMERVAVWALMSGGGGGKDVFTVILMHCCTDAASLCAMLCLVRGCMMFVKGTANLAVCLRTWVVPVGTSCLCHGKCELCQATQRVAHCCC